MPKKVETAKERAIRELLGISSDEESGDEGPGPSGPDPVVVDPNQLQCQGACGNKHPKENTVHCEAGHIFCFDDARTYTLAQLGSGTPVLKCILGTCDKIFPGSEVLKYIDLDIFKGFPKDRLLLMIGRVGVTDLVEICPNCNYVNNCGLLGPGNENFVCRNADCKRDTCRKCKRLSHGSIDCDSNIQQTSLECEHCIALYPPHKLHPASNIVRCEIGHPFCIESATAYLTSQLGKGIPVINCLHQGCDKIFPGTEVLRFIDLDVFKGLPKATLEKMIERVGVKGLVEICPKCLTVNNTGPLSATTILKCRNTECNRISCRKCRRLSHDPPVSDCDTAAKSSFECLHCLKIYPSPNDIIRCAKGHPYCFDAARESLAAQVGTGITALKCLDEGCTEAFPGSEVLRFIDLNLFKGWPREKLEKLIESAGVKGLVELCPNCDTIVICGPVEETNVLHCTNSECKKAFCRKCNKPAHGNITCEENAAGVTGGAQTGTGGTAPGGTTSPGTVGPGTTGSGGAGGNATGPGGATSPGGSTTGSGGAGAGAGAGAGGAGKPGCECETTTRQSLEEFITQSIVNAKGKLFAEALLGAALFRLCKNCGENILKKNGENYLHCGRCKATQCYICGDAVTDEAHFKETSKPTCVNKQFDVAPTA